MKKKVIRKYCLISLMIMAGLLFLFPVIHTVIKSLETQPGISFSGYVSLFSECFPFYRMFWNSMLYSVTVTIGTIIIAIPAAYAFSYARFPGKRILYIIYIMIMLMPLQVMVLPNYIGLRDMKLLNTPLAIILPLLFSPIAVVVFHQYMQGNDDWIVEAARLETNSCIKIIYNCTVPQIRPCILPVSLLVFAETWNMVEQPLLYLNDDKWRNLSLMFSEAAQYQPEVIMPAAVMFMIPVLLLYLYSK